MRRFIARHGVTLWRALFGEEIDDVEAVNVIIARSTDAGTALSTTTRLALEVDRAHCLVAAICFSDEASYPMPAPEATQ